MPDMLLLEIDTTTMVSVSQGSPQHTMYTTSGNKFLLLFYEDDTNVVVIDDGSFDENDGVVAVVSAWFMSLAEYIGRFFTGETAVLSQLVLLVFRCYDLVITFHCI